MSDAKTKELLHPRRDLDIDRILSHTANVQGCRVYLEGRDMVTFMQRICCMPLIDPHHPWMEGISMDVMNFYQSFYLSHRNYLPPIAIPSIGSRDPYR